MVRAGHAHFATIHKFYLAVADDLPDRARRAAEACVRQDLVQSRCSSHFSPENENAEQPRSCQGSFAFLSMLLRTKGARYFVRSVTIHLVGVLRPFGGRRTAYGEKQVRRGSRLAVPHERWVTPPEIRDEPEEKRRFRGVGYWGLVRPGEPSRSDGRPIRRVLGRKNTVPGTPWKSRAPADETGTRKAKPIQPVRYGGGSREGQLPQESADGPLFSGCRPMTDPVI